MKKYRCTLTQGSYLYYATVVATDERQATELAAVEANEKWSGYGLGRAKWNSALVDSSVSGPARVLECSYHNK